MTQAEHNIAHRKIEAAQRALRDAALFLGSYTGDMNPTTAALRLSTAQSWAEAARRYIEEKA